jgi:hypothetical protein
MTTKDGEPLGVDDLEGDDLSIDPSLEVDEADEVGEIDEGGSAGNERLRVAFGRFRLHWAPMLRQARAEAASLLLGAIAFEMDQPWRRVPYMPLTAQTWAHLGNCSEQERRTMLRALHRVPGIVRLAPNNQSLLSKYTVHKGRWFDKMPLTIADDGNNYGGIQ